MNIQDRSRSKLIFKYLECKYRLSDKADFMLKKACLHRTAGRKNNSSPDVFIKSVQNPITIFGFLLQFLSESTYQVSSDTFKLTQLSCFIYFLLITWLFGGSRCGTERPGQTESSQSRWRRSILNKSAEEIKGWVTDVLQLRSSCAQHIFYNSTLAPNISAFYDFLPHSPAAPLVCFPFSFCFSKFLYS